jgi:hypothetical protein
VKEQAIEEAVPQLGSVEGASALMGQYIETSFGPGIWIAVVGGLITIGGGIVLLLTSGPMTMTEPSMPPGAGSGSTPTSPPPPSSPGTDPPAEPTPPPTAPPSPPAQGGEAAPGEDQADGAT